MSDVQPPAAAGEPELQAVSEGADEAPPTAADGEEPAIDGADAGPGTAGSADGAGGPFADWAPGVHDLIPLLPRGTALFEGLPAGALVIDALSPAIGHGAVIVRGTEAVGIVLVKDGAGFEQYAFESGTSLEGSRALQAIASWDGAVVAAYRFDPLVVAVVPALFRGAPCYEDLRLDWTDWHGLLSDLFAREGSFVVELDTPLGRGVTLIVDGRQVATYTEGHPELGPETLLDPLAETKRGTIWVRREPAGAQDGAAAPGSETEAGAEMGRAPAEPGGALDWSAAPPWGTEPEPELAADLYAAPPPSYAPPQQLPGSPFAPFALGASSDPLWGAPGPESYSGVADAGQPRVQPASVAVLAPQLKQVARARLQRSSSKVETMVDEAAARDLPLDVLLSDIRGLVIRGVMQSTLDQVADEMAAMVAAGID